MRSTAVTRALPGPSLKEDLAKSYLPILFFARLAFSLHQTVFDRVPYVRNLGEGGTL